MDFPYGEAFTETTPEAYERLLLDVLLGDATLFPRNEEVEASWRVIDPIEQFWAEQDRPAAARAVPRRRVGAQGRRRDAGPRRPHLASTVTAPVLARDRVTTLWDTTGTAVVKALARRAAQGRRGLQRPGPHPGRRGRGGPRRRGGAGGHARRRRAPVPAARRGAPPARRRRGRGSTPRSWSADGSARARPSSCACTAGSRCTPSRSSCRCSPRTRPSSPGGSARRRSSSRTTRSGVLADRRVTDSQPGRRPARRAAPARRPTTPRATPTWPGRAPRSGGRCAPPRFDSIESTARRRGRRPGDPSRRACSWPAGSARPRRRGRPRRTAARPGITEVAHRRSRRARCASPATTVGRRLLSRHRPARPPDAARAARPRRPAGRGAAPPRRGRDLRARPVGRHRGATSPNDRAPRTHIWQDPAEERAPTRRSTTT